MAATRHPRAAAALAGLALGLLPASTSGGDTLARMPGPAALRAGDPAALDQTCEGCHQDIAREWRGSRHQRAYVDAPFQSALAREPSAFCRGCHAPEARVELGVACVTCHVTGGAVLASPRPGEAPPSPHPVTRDARFASPSACAGCHEFAFPDGARRRAPEPMQLTVSEHAASPYRAVACARCHMPGVGPAGARHRSHAFAASRDPEAQREALRVSAERPTARAVRLTLDVGRVGHAFPTGDLFRRLVVRAEVEGQDHAVLASAHRYLARHFGETSQPLGAHAREAIADDRPGAPALAGRPVVVELDLGPEAGGRPVDYEIAYQRVSAVNDGREDAAVVESEVVLARGRLPQGPP